MSEGRVELSKDHENHIATIIIRRSLAGNLMTRAMAAEFATHLANVDEDDDVKVVLIRGEGDDLCAGWDPADAWSQYREAPGGAVRKHPSQRARLIALDDAWWGSTGLYQRLLHCRKVTIVEARGRCWDTGLYLVLCADLVVAGEDATFGSPRWHNVGVDGDMSLLFATVGLKRAKELMYCNVAWSASTALDYGLVDRVDEDAPYGASELAATCASIMRDGIVTEKYAVFASLEKLGIGLSFAATTVVGASLSNIHFQPDEFNFLRQVRHEGAEAALVRSRKDVEIR
ncbi:enoyl-CoA hydratase/isomerase family protein [Dactylosporangium sp. NPDC005572]|uniref:enoyl-CoA hydratase/isomerase family protein n=1 Tax=Dactylosporangium sp. NPDC005572 TaxID=3156889 RepID=UPI0033A2E397